MRGTDVVAGNVFVVDYFPPVGVLRIEQTVGAVADDNTRSLKGVGNAGPWSSHSSIGLFAST